MGITDFFKRGSKSHFDAEVYQKLMAGIPQYIRDHGDFVSLCNVWGHFQPDSAGHEDFRYKFPNGFVVTVWRDLSAEFYQALADLSNQNQIHMVPASIDIYTLDCGYQLKLPILPTNWEEVNRRKEYFLPHVLTTSASTAEKVAANPRITTYAIVHPGGRVQDDIDIW